MPPRSASRRQPLLITTRSPLSERFGDAFFRQLPAGPGVYFFRDAAGALLYIGQSGSLRHRVGSYRHIDSDRHPRRLLRLIHRVARIEWRECGSAREAIALESRLLLEHRPPFNRAGVWPAAVWWLRVRVEDGRLHLHLSRTPDAETPEQWHGPLSSRQRHAFPALARCLHLVMHPLAGPWELPVGLIRNHALRTHSWPLPPETAELLGEFTRFLVQPTAAFPDFLRESLAGVLTGESHRGLRDFWEEQLEEIAALAPVQREEP